MKRTFRFVLTALSCAAAFNIAAFADSESGGQAASAPSETPAEPPQGMKLILCIGQDNMAGRTKATDEDRVEVPNAYKLDRDGKWVAAKTPYHFDRRTAGVGPVDDFVRLYLADRPGESVGVVPCAVGGSSISSRPSSGTRARRTRQGMTATPSPRPIPAA